MVLFDKNRASGPGGSSQDDIYGICCMWSYFQGFNVLFFSRSACILPRVLRSKPLKISPLETLGGIIF